MESPDIWLTKRLAATAEQFGQRRARQMLRDLRLSATKRAEEHKERLRHRKSLGKEVIKAGLESWSQDEVLGLLLDGRDRIAGSPTLRLGIRKRGESFRAVRAPSGRSRTAHSPAPPPTVH